MFIEVDPNEVSNTREGRRGRVNYPIIKAFMELNKPLVKLDRKEFKGRSTALLYQGLSSYAKSHDMPIKVFTRQGEVFMVRLDMNDDGTPNENYIKEREERTANVPEPGDVAFIDADEIMRNAENEEDVTT